MKLSLPFTVSHPISKKLQKIYFDTDDIDSFENTRINLIDFEKKELRNIYMVSSN